MSQPYGGRDRNIREYDADWTLGQEEIAAGEAAPTLVTHGLSALIEDEANGSTSAARFISLRVRSIADVTDYDCALYVWGGVAGEESWAKVKGTEIVDETEAIQVRYQLDGDCTRFDWVFTTITDGGTPLLAWEYRLG